MTDGFLDYLKRFGEVGYVSRTVAGILEVEGLPGVALGEMVTFESGEKGQVTQLAESGVEVLVMAKEAVGVGTRVSRTGKKLEVGVGEGSLGRVVDALGRPITGTGVIGGDTRPVEVVPSGIAGRKRIGRQLVTGLTMIDLMIPIGKGQRELILGDRKTGKSLVLWRIILGQARLGSICVYAAVGRQKSEITKLSEFFTRQKAAENLVVVAAAAEDSPGEIFLCPYTAMTIAEYFRDKGRDVLLVLDDMTTHAQFYRELSLVSKKFPGRDSYPGDIFHVHSRLLERAGNFEVKLGDGRVTEAAITCLPVAQTVQGDLAGYIETNLMSMTDGHIYFDNDLFFAGRRPAINPFVSVTRVGRQTQTPIGRDAGRVLYDLLNSYEKTQSFLRFGAELGENSRQILNMGDKVLKFFDQPEDVMAPLPVGQVGLAGILCGLWETKDLERLGKEYASDPEMYKLVNEAAGQAQVMGELIDVVRRNPALGQGRQYGQ